MPAARPYLLELAGLLTLVVEQSLFDYPLAGVDIQTCKPLLRHLLNGPVTGANMLPLVIVATVDSCSLATRISSLPLN